MSEKIDRRKFLVGAGAGSLLAAGLTGCQNTGFKAEKNASKPHLIMVYDQNKCVGCDDCKIACNKANKLPKGRSRVVLQAQPGHERGDRRYIRVSCQQCQNSPCVRVCPTGAAHRDPKTGIVTMDASKCVGCKYCIVACPYNVRFINEETKAAENCDFCLQSRLSKGKELPACVEACRYGAISFGDENDPKSYVSRLLKVKDSVRIKPYLGTEPSLRYIPVVDKGV